MKSITRHDVMVAFYQFYPASVSVIARISHFEDIVTVDVFANQLEEDGILFSCHNSTGLRVYALTDFGRSMIASDSVPPVLVSKMKTFHTVVRQEAKHHTIRSLLMEIIDRSSYYLTIYELIDHLEVATHTSYMIPEVHAVLYGLLDEGRLVVMGPQYISCKSMLT